MQECGLVGCHWGRIRRGSRIFDHESRALAYRSRAAISSFFSTRMSLFVQCLRKAGYGKVTADCGSSRYPGPSESTAISHSSGGRFSCTLPHNVLGHRNRACSLDAQAWLRVLRLVLFWLPAAADGPPRGCLPNRHQPNTCCAYPDLPLERHQLLFNKNGGYDQTDADSKQHTTPELSTQL